MAQENNPVVFISYSHDSEDHARNVLDLSERLRHDGIETILDQYVPGGSPPEGWPRWMMDGLQRATRVLCVCTETYYRRFRGHEVPETGRGVDWEGAIITTELYDVRSVSKKFIPVLFSKLASKFIPEPMRGQTWHVPNTETGYQKLYDAILVQSGVEPAPIGTLRRKLRAVHKWSEKTIASVVPASLILQAVTVAGAALWCLLMRLFVTAAVCFVIAVILTTFELLRRRGALPAFVGNICKNIWIDNRAVKTIFFSVPILSILLSFVCTFVLIESLPPDVEWIEVTAGGRTTPWKLATGNRGILFCPPWGRPVTINAPKHKPIVSTAGPWRPFCVSNNLFVASVRIVLQCSDELRRVLPSSPDEPKAAIKINYDQRELFSGEFTGQSIVLTNDLSSADESYLFVSDSMLSLPGQLKIEVFNAAGDLMVGPLEFTVKDVQNSITIPKP